MNRWAMMLAAGLLSACAAQENGTPGATACDLTDPVLTQSAFVIATSPLAGARVQSGFAVSGCSRTFESNVIWRLLARDGSVMARGFTSGGGVDGPGAFAFSVEFTVAAPEIGHLEVTADDPSDGEGFPPGRTVLPLLLMP